MKRHFLTYCLMCVVSLAAVLAFYSCNNELITQLSGAITVYPHEGPVGTTFTVQYNGKDRDKIERFRWEYKGGINSSDFGYGSTFTAHKAGTLTVTTETKRGYGNLTSPEINVYSIQYNPTITTEDKEVTSTGLLYIYGLGNYSGRVIKGEEILSQRILAYQSAFNTYKYIDGSLSDIYEKGTNPGSVADNYASLKLFICVPNNDETNLKHYEGYTGDDQNVKFKISIMAAFTLVDGNYVSLPAVDGTVTVNFTNGFGEGTFVPDP
jgi:hypothetical protein